VDVLCICVYVVESSNSGIGLRFVSFGWNPSFLVKLSRISIPLILVELRLQIRRYNIY
jgi:hypothetical protein